MQSIVQGCHRGTLGAASGTPEFFFQIRRIKDRVELGVQINNLFRIGGLVGAFTACRLFPRIERFVTLLARFFLFSGIRGSFVALTLNLAFRRVHLAFRAAAFLSFAALRSIRARLRCNHQVHPGHGGRQQHRHNHQANAPTPGRQHHGNPTELLIPGQFRPNPRHDSHHGDEHRDNRDNYPQSLGSTLGTGIRPTSGGTGHTGRLHSARTTRGTPRRTGENIAKERTVRGMPCTHLTPQSRICIQMPSFHKTLVFFHSGSFYPQSPLA